MLFEVQFIFLFTAVVHGVLTPEYEKIQDRKNTFAMITGLAPKYLFSTNGIPLRKAQHQNVMAHF